MNDVDERGAKLKEGSLDLSCFVVDNECCRG